MVCESLSRSPSSRLTRAAVSKNGADPRESCKRETLSNGLPLRCACRLARNGARGGSPSRPNACGGSALHGPHGAPRVAPQNLQNIIVRIAALHQAAHQVGDLRHIFHAFRKLIVRAVEIRSQSHIIHARHLYGLIEVIQQAAERQAPQLGGALRIDGTHRGVQLAAIAELGRLCLKRVLLRLLVLQCVNPVHEAAVQKTFLPKAYDLPVTRFIPSYAEKVSTLPSASARVNRLLLAS